MHSATKFIAGHSDVMAGVLAVKGERLTNMIPTIFYYFSKPFFAIDEFMSTSYFLLCMENG